MKKFTCFVLLALALVTGCKAPKDLEYKDVQNFSIKQAGLKKTTVSMDVRLYNPNKYKLKLKKSDIDVYLNGNLIGKVNINSRVSVTRLETSVLPVILDLNPGAALPGLFNVAFGGDVTIKLSGFIKAGRHGVYIRVPVNYEGKQDILAGIR